MTKVNITSLQGSVLCTETEIQCNLEFLICDIIVEKLSMVSAEIFHYSIQCQFLF